MRDAHALLPTLAASSPGVGHEQLAWSPIPPDPSNSTVTLSSRPDARYRRAPRRLRTCGVALAPPVRVTRRVLRRLEPPNRSFRRRRPRLWPAPPGAFPPAGRRAAAGPTAGVVPAPLPAPPPASAFQEGRDGSDKLEPSGPVARAPPHERYNFFARARESHVAQPSLFPRALRAQPAERARAGTKTVPRAPASVHGPAHFEPPSPWCNRHQGEPPSGPPVPLVGRADERRLGEVPLDQRRSLPPLPRRSSPSSAAVSAHFRRPRRSAPARSRGARRPRRPRRPGTGRSPPAAYRVLQRPGRDRPSPWPHPPGRRSRRPPPAKRRPLRWAAVSGIRSGRPSGGEQRLPPLGRPRAPAGRTRRPRSRAGARSRYGRTPRSSRGI